MNFMENRLSKFENDIANQFGHNVFYNNVLYAYFIICWKNVLIRVFYFDDNVSSSLDGNKWVSFPFLFWEGVEGQQFLPSNNPKNLTFIKILSTVSRNQWQLNKIRCMVQNLQSQILRLKILGLHFSHSLDNENK